MINRLKVLIVAAAVHPERGSEPGLGWGWVQALSQLHDVHVITGEREGNRTAIEERIEKDPQYYQSLTFSFIPRPYSPGIFRQLTPVYYYYYRKWHQQAFSVARDLCHVNHFDLVHQLNMTGYREPGLLWKLDKPFVWGPVGGTSNVPLRFFRELGVLGSIYQLLKVTANNVQLITSPRVRSALRRADGFVTSRGDAQRTFKKRLKATSIRINDNGPPVSLIDSKDRHHIQNTEEFQIVWSGLHVSRKALPIALKALALVGTTKSWRLKILGSGPQTIRWKNIAQKLGISEKCTWTGWVTKAESELAISEADILLMPSLHESTPAVLFEALAAGTPVVCFDLCGQADVIDDSCGIKVAMSNRADMIKNMSKAIDHIVEDDVLLRQLSIGATRRVKKFGWDSKAQEMSKVYESALSARSI